MWIGSILILLLVLYLYGVTKAFIDRDKYIKEYAIVVVTSEKVSSGTTLKFDVAKDDFHYERIERKHIKRWEFKPYCVSTVWLQFDNDETRKLFIKCGLLEKFANDAWRGLMSVEVMI